MSAKGDKNNVVDTLSGETLRLRNQPVPQTLHASPSGTQSVPSGFLLSPDFQAAHHGALSRACVADTPVTLCLDSKWDTAGSVVLESLSVGWTD